MTKARTATTTTIESRTDTDRRSDALAWASRQFRFEQLISSLERPVAS